MKGAKSCMETSTYFTIRNRLIKPYLKRMDMITKLPD